MEARILQKSFLSDILGKSIVDAKGNIIGHLRDIAVRWDAGHAEVTGIKYAKNRQSMLATSEVIKWGPHELRLRHELHQTIKNDLQSDEIYVGKWLLDKQIIDIKGSKLVRVNDIEMALIEQDGSRKLILMAVDIGIRGLLRRVGLEFLVRKRENMLLGWQYIMPLETRTDDLKLCMDLSQARLGQLHPADIADIIEDLSQSRRLELLNNLDSQTAAEVLSEVESETRSDIMENMEDSRASIILQEMAPDEAADVLGELTREKSDQLLTLMEEEDASDIRKLMEYDDDTAGAMMTTEYIFFSPQDTAEETINRLRQLSPSAETIYYLYVLDEKASLLGVVSLRQLIVAAPYQTLDQVMEHRVITVNPLDDARSVSEAIAKYDLLAVPVVDEQGSMLGIITVDDVIETILPDRSRLETFSTYLLRGKLARRHRTWAHS